MDDHGVVRARVVATSAVRDAGNAEEFMAEAALHHGGASRGSLGRRGGTAVLRRGHGPPAGPTWPGSGPLLVVDIGGGSTELAVGHPGPGAAAPDVVARSLDIGCVRVSERFLHDPPRPEDLAPARGAVTEEVMAARADLPQPAPDGLVIGLAGTVSTLVCLDRGITVYDRARVHHAVLSRD